MQIGEVKVKCIQMKSMKTLRYVIGLKVDA